MRIKVLGLLTVADASGPAIDQGAGIRYWGEVLAFPGYSRHWKAIDGRLYPARWEAVWHLPDGDFEAVRMEVERVATE